MVTVGCATIVEAKRRAIVIQRCIVEMSSRSLGYHPQHRISRYTATKRPACECLAMDVVPMTRTKVMILLTGSLSDGKRRL